MYVKETDPDFDLCAICVEGYRAGDVLRIMPCKYVTSSLLMLITVYFSLFPDFSCQLTEAEVCC